MRAQQNLPIGGSQQVGKVLFVRHDRLDDRDLVIVLKHCLHRQWQQTLTGLLQATVKGFFQLVLHGPDGGRCNDGPDYRHSECKRQAEPALQTCRTKHYATSL